MIEIQHCALCFVNVFITNAASTCFGTYVPSSGSVFVLVSTWKLRQLCAASKIYKRGVTHINILEAVHSCLSFHVLTRTKTLPEDGTKLQNHNTVHDKTPPHRAHQFTLPEAVHSCLSFHVLTRTKTLPEDGTQVPKHVRAALVINTLTKPSAQCWFAVHNPAIHGTNIKRLLCLQQRRIQTCYTKFGSDQTVKVPLHLYRLEFMAGTVVHMVTTGLWRVKFLL
jgi:hypothetical protein